MFFRDLKLNSYVYITKQLFYYFFSTLNSSLFVAALYAQLLKPNPSSSTDRIGLCKLVAACPCYCNNATRYNRAAAWADEVSDNRTPVRDGGVNMPVNNFDLRDRASDVRDSDTNFRGRVMDMSDNSFNLRDRAVCLRDGDTEVRDGAMNLRDSNMNPRDSNMNPRDGVGELRDGGLNLSDRVFSFCCRG
ncbi:hypothetical protein AQPE_3966 [Aquipluma nitroreducens]|uniref:Uncharacterized protein n=1 Tax=Aquipluma nitroreducens TaxID=2010828 RepID=A0A5K7SDY0_9BACT|nr:hypothetical protein AQPE_3966 [Aquipluma nitroreducens]